MASHSVLLENGLSALIDWLSFTIKQTLTLEEVFSLFGLSRSDFYMCERGANGYARKLMHCTSNIYILFEGTSDNMGIHIDISGSAIGKFLSYYVNTGFSKDPNYIFASLLEDILSIGNFTRIDLAIDDFGANYFTPQEIFEYAKQDLLSTRFRSGLDLTPFSLQSGFETTGSTLTFGSRTSSVYLRIYDKQAEQNEKLAKSGKDLIMQPWTRWELECHKKTADNVAKQIISSLDIGSTIVGVLSNYFRVIVRDNANVSRCSSHKKWEAFINGIEKVRISVPHKPLDIDEKREYLLKQTAPSLAAVIIADGGSMDFFQQLVESGYPRMNKELYEQAIAYSNIPKKKRTSYYDTIGSAW